MTTEIHRFHRGTQMRRRGTTEYTDQTESRRRKHALTTARRWLTNPFSSSSFRVFRGSPPRLFSSWYSNLFESAKSVDRISAHSDRDYDKTISPGPRVGRRVS